VELANEHVHAQILFGQRQFELSVIRLNRLVTGRKVGTGAVVKSPMLWRDGSDPLSFEVCGKRPVMRDAAQTPRDSKSQTIAGERLALIRERAGNAFCGCCCARVQCAGRTSWT
jgi:hypothetical protein